jgi:hypothetical protein
MINSPQRDMVDALRGIRQRRGADRLIVIREELYGGKENLRD